MAPKIKELNRKSKVLEGSTGSIKAENYIRNTTPKPHLPHITPEYMDEMLEKGFTMADIMRASQRMQGLDLVVDLEIARNAGDVRLSRDIAQTIKLIAENMPSDKLAQYIELANTYLVQGSF